ncbi:hypothetical protein [Chlorobium sp.]|uniref:hypothetical protein n=1 Tax=Chlorobium sp. TaxID=1095 RepID=UPI002F408A51
MRKITKYTLLLPLLFSWNTAYSGIVDNSNNGGQAESCGTESSAASTSAAQGVGVGVGNFSQTFEASDNSPYMPGTVGAPVLGPTLFNIIGRPAQVNGIPILANNFFSAAVHDLDIGRSRGTKIIYNGALLPEKADNKDRRVSFDFSGQTTGEIIGSITIQSKKSKADEVDVPTLIYDATQYIAQRKDLKGYNITLLSIQKGISYGLGVDAKGDGFSLSPVLSGLINGPAGLLAGAASGFSKASGVTVPTGIVGCTFLVVADTENGRPININENYSRGFSDVEVSEANQNGNGKKRYEATK